MLFAKIVVCWVLLSCTLGPLFTWLFFYGDREAQRNRFATGAMTHHSLPMIGDYGSGAAHLR